MARKARKPLEAPEAVEPVTLGDAFEPETPISHEDRTFPPADPVAGSETEASGEERKPFVSKLPDPHGRHQIDIGDGRKMRLYLNRRFFQNAIQFTAPDGQNPKPDAEATTWLKDHGWTWRNQDFVWTKQLERNSEQAPYARAGSDKQAEDEFVELANCIRERKGLEPVQYAFAEDRGAGR